MIGKGFDEIFRSFEADCVCLQETKMQAGQCDVCFTGYSAHFNYAERKGYSGTAIFTRCNGAECKAGIGIAEHDTEGRVLTLDLGTCYLVNVYTPNSQNELARLPYRMTWDEAFARYVTELDKTKPVIICGDLNVAHNDIDLSNPQRNHRNAGFTDQERAGFQRLLDCGFVDSFRHFYPDRAQAYTWWSYRFRGRERNIGWRIDYFLVSERLLPKLRSAHILNEVMGSDHCPVSIEIDF